jgi:transposase
MSCDDAGTKPIRRLEVFTGAGCRRDWSDETKAAIVAESYAGVESISAVARRHALMPSQLFTWRRQARRAAAAAANVSQPASASMPLFVPAVIEPQMTPSVPGVEPVPRKRRVRGAREAAVELEIDGVAVKIARGADAGVIAAVIDALKASR